jgi:diguanylate cyclase (GGDEF)-like protein
MINPEEHLPAHNNDITGHHGGLDDNGNNIYLFNPGYQIERIEGPKHKASILREAASAVLESSLREEIYTLRTTSEVDGETNLYNKPKFYALVEDAIREQEESKDKAPQFGVMFMDLDNFKKLNDKLGHEVGDEVIKRIAEFIEKRLKLRKEDYVTEPSRWGGDEFAIVFGITKKDNERRNVDPTITAEESLALAEKKTVERLISLLQEDMDEISAGLGEDVASLAEQYGLSELGISVGTAIYIPGDTRETLLKRADEAMYKDKEAKKKALALKNGLAPS